MTNYDSNLLFGTDPEYFITDNNGFGIPVPHFIENLGVEEIGYDETRKHPVIIKGDDFKVIMDGIATECNFTPSKTPQEMYNKIKKAIDSIGDLATKYGYNVSLVPTVKYDFDKWYNPKSKLFSWCGIFGCDADRDAIVPEYNSPEIDVREHKYRYGGGHWHMSDQNVLLDKYPMPMIKLLAITCGNYSISSSPYPELEKLRAFKYGQPGRYRAQNYPDGNIGIEYRSPSNVWSTDINTVEGMFYYAQKAYDYLKNPKKAVELMEEYLPQTITAIANVDQSLSHSILSSIN